MMIYRDEETYHIFDDQNGGGEDQKFEFKDSYWDEMESILDTHDAKKKRRRAGFFIFSSAATLALVLGFSGIFHSDMGTSAIVWNEGNLNSVQNNNAIASTTDQNNPSENTVETDLADEKAQLTNDNSTPEKFKAETISNSAKSENKTLNSKTEEIASTSNPEMKLEDEIANTTHSEENLENNTIIETGELVPMNVMAANLVENNQAANSIQLEKRKVKYIIKHSLSANAEAGIVNKYNPGKGVSYGVMAGLGYELGFHKNLSFQTGVNFLYRGGLNQEYRKESKVYGFHSIRYFQDVNYKGQINVEIPLALKVKFKRSSITAGVGTSFLLGVNSSVKQFMPESSQVEEVNNNFGIREGIRNMDVTLNLAYGYAVSPNIELTAGLSAGLLDQTDNAFFGNTINNHNLQFRVGMKYFFLNK